MKTTLFDMLSYCRPAGSVTESIFIDRYIKTIPGVYQDGGKNWHVVIGDTPVILWSCHTDTVHNNEGRQTTHYNPATGLISLSRRSKGKDKFGFGFKGGKPLKSWNRSDHFNDRKSNCLGADDTAGVWLCTEMIKRGIAGHYIFHFGEEIGGIGSGKLATGKDWAEGIKCAIALDRKGYSDVITHQIGRCASDAFALSLSAELNKGKPTLDYEPSDQGIFTDTANYTGIIGECTNLSVGYFHMHSVHEELDLLFLQRMLESLCAVDASRLVFEREPGDYELDDSFDYTTPQTWGWGNSNYRGPTISRLGEGFCDRDNSASTEREYCFNCGILYRVDESLAIHYTRYCSRPCEDDATERQDQRLEYWRREAEHEKELNQRLVPVDTLARLSKARSIYLDDEYAEVQQILTGKVN